MSPTQRRARVLVGGVVCTVLLAGCGGSAPKPDPVREKRVVAELNAFCRRLTARRASGRRSLQQTEATLARLGALTTALDKGSAYLPAGRDLNAAEDARRALEPPRAGSGGLLHVRQPGFAARFRQVELRIAHDYRALGLTSCTRTGSPVSR